MKSQSSLQHIEKFSTSLWSCSNWCPLCKNNPHHTTVRSPLESQPMQVAGNHCLKPGEILYFRKSILLTPEIGMEEPRLTSMSSSSGKKSSSSCKPRVVLVKSLIKGTLTASFPALELMWIKNIFNRICFPIFNKDNSYVCNYPKLLLFFWSTLTLYMPLTQVSNYNSFHQEN